MPYIQQGRRLKLIKGKARPETPGELNFMMSQMFADYIDDHDLSYKTINDIVGAAEGAKMEFYRRVAVPYENTKLAANGDVYELHSKYEED